MSIRCAEGKLRCSISPHKRKTLNNNGLNQFAGRPLLFKQWFAADARSCNLRKTGSVYCYLRIFLIKGTYLVRICNPASPITAYLHTNQTRYGHLIWLAIVWLNLDNTDCQRPNKIELWIFVKIYKTTTYRDYFVAHSRAAGPKFTPAKLLKKCLDHMKIGHVLNE